MAGTVNRNVAPWVAAAVGMAVPTRGASFTPVTLKVMVPMVLDVLQVSRTFHWNDA
ncbi:unnamed protein product [Pararhodospirillum photometricum DSM 122]|uniref:Uncharacterized protein n=1 Tax=Pararhodospirillum photometricum DSM 122 TaxID=1150469 RepID=H6SM47_PARPM|nr:unnamed protein product [Pararhodospirillum photometricum DSM 122]